MKRALVALLLAGALAVPVLADVILLPGVSFIGTTDPALTFEGIMADSQGAKIFFGLDNHFIVAFRYWPWGYSFATDSFPGFIGIGVATRGMDGQYVAGFYGEGGLRLFNLFEVAFAIELTGASSQVSLNFGISIALPPIKPAE